MCRSMTTASGERFSASSIASRPLLAAATTASSGWRSISFCKADRKEPSSSAIRTRIRAAVASVVVLVIGGKASLARVAIQETGQPVAIIGAALDLGAGRRGVDMGPSAIRYAGLEPRISGLGRRCEDCGNVVAPVAEASAVGDERMRFLAAIKETCERIADQVVRAVEGGYLPLVLGGDHSVALGTLGGLARASGPGGVLWLDAHGDLNRPETSPTGNVHGMPLAAALGLAGPEFDSPAFRLPAVDPTRIALVGVRELDDGERNLLSELDARVYTMSHVDRL